MATDPAAYELTRAPDGTAYVARENLTDIIRRELLGPANGEDEVLGAKPDARYILGRIAPTKLLDGDDPPTSESDGDDTADVGTEFGDAWEASQSTGLPVGGESDIDGEEDDGADDAPVKRGLMIPASMGLRFQVPHDLDTFTITASWGTYEPRSTGEITQGGRAKREFVRTQHDERVAVTVADLTEGRTKEFVLKEHVVLRLDTHVDEERAYRLIEVALCNDYETPRNIPVGAWLFQTQLVVEGPEGAAVFLPIRDVMRGDDQVETDDEVRRLDLQYRDRLEFAIGRICSADWDVDDGSRRARVVRTEWLPSVETPQTRATEVDGALLDMLALADASAADIDEGLRPILDAYAVWLGDQRAKAEALPPHLRSVAADTLEEAEWVHGELIKGLDFLVNDDEALLCFRFMNRVMAEQRIQSQVVEERSKNPKLSIDQVRDEVLTQGPGRAHSWRTFQIAFILLQIRGMCIPGEARRSGDVARVELLFFPTGGGKTEAYLGLAAYTFAIRRRQGIVDTPDGPLDGGKGIAVLMRYTLRLLTSQQFQRATTMVCAAELERRKKPDIWGAEPFRIGLWVGSAVSPKRVEDADRQVKQVRQQGGKKLDVLQVRRCPWCGSIINPQSDVRVDMDERRVRVFCGDDLGDCPFERGGQVDDGLPVLTTDEEIYRLVPAFVIATVDKFARLAREGEAASLFGYVSEWCPRHGFFHPDYRHCASSHLAKDALPRVTRRPHPRLRPPDLIIQDELHLISGSLGTTVGLFEVAIDVLTTWQWSDGTRVKPLIVASTATARNAEEQVRGLYGRDAGIFPPRVIDADDTYFSREVPISRDAPGRRYVGISTTGVRLTKAEIRLVEIVMAGAQLMMDRCGDVADPYMTLVGYFNAMRELAGMTRYLNDDIRTALAKGVPSSGLPKRSGTNFGELERGELTSRADSATITDTLDRMSVEFTSEFDSSTGRAERIERSRAGEQTEKRVTPYDVVLATAMLQVGVDVTRLGLMLIVGQPKNTAEYIQASSRVGRDPLRPGLVLSLGNWARPRDLSHFEQFRHYHETFYKQVEPLSVTPFSATSMERGLDGVLVSAARVMQASVPGGLSPEKSAGKIEAQREVVERLIDALTQRVQDAAGEDLARAARERLVGALDRWGARNDTVRSYRKSLVYERVGKPSDEDPLMTSAESGFAAISRADNLFVVANSMREVQPEINLLVSPDKDKMYDKPLGTPDWAARSATRSKEEAS